MAGTKRNAARDRGGPCLDPNGTCRMQDIQMYEEIAREADASIERIARIFAEMGADAATMEKSALHQVGRGC